MIIDIIPAPEMKRFDVTHLASPPVIRLDRSLSLRTLWTRRGNRDDVRVSIRINPTSACFLRNPDLDGR
jgi:hypothetical protein